MSGPIEQAADRDGEGKIERAERRRAKAREEAEKSKARVAKLMADERLAADPAYAAILQRDAELRADVHLARINWTKKSAKLRRLLKAAGDLYDELEQFHKSE